MLICSVAVMGVTPLRLVEPPGAATSDLELAARLAEADVDQVDAAHRSGLVVIAPALFGLRPLARAEPQRAAVALEAAEHG
jgi:hypothetical protein